MDIGAIKEEEVKAIIRKLKWNKAAGRDDLPAEFWKAIERNAYIVQWFAKFCTTCWQGQEIPQEWRIANVACIFKKGDSNNLRNYHPISLLNTGYKLFASVLKRRLADALDRYLQPTQYGFRQNRFPRIFALGEWSSPGTP